jgi:transcriptional regulator with XRE-family HTH domain
MEALAAWLVDQMRERNLSARETSLGAGLSHGAISHFLNGKRPSRKSCDKLAEFFGVPKEVLLIMAGYQAPPPEYNQFLYQLGQLSKDWTEAEKEFVLSLVRQYAASRPAR